jgi:carbon-monoxide dehydrogenase medium subunit
LTGPELTFVAPTTMPDALDELAQPGTLALAGGTSVAMMLKHGLLDATRLVYLVRVPQLAGIESLEGRRRLRIGATVTVAELAMSPLVWAAVPALGDAGRRVGNPRVRAVATVGGAVVHADPRQDLPAVLLALDAEVHIDGPKGPRTMALEAFLTGMFETALEGGEIVTSVVVPVPAGLRTAYTRFTPGSVDDYPTVAVAATLTLDAAGVVATARIAVGGAGPTAFVAAEASELLCGRQPTFQLLVEAGEAAAAASRPLDDRAGSAAYKREMVAVWVRRTLADALAGADS